MNNRVLMIMMSIRICSETSECHWNVGECKEGQCNEEDVLG